MKPSLHAFVALGILAGCFALGSQRLFADRGTSEGQLRFLLVPTEANDQVRIVPAGDTIPTDGTVVTCAGIRFSVDGLIFEDAVIETNDQRTTASQVTLFTKDASLKFSKDHRIFFKNVKGRGELFRALSQ